MYLSENSSYYETTYSLDQHIEHYLKEKRRAKEEAERFLEEQREQEIENYFNSKDDDIFNLPGLTFLKFTHKKVRFSFEPAKVVDFVSQKTKFYCTLVYLPNYKWWTVKRDSIPVGPHINYKRKVETIFQRNPHISDETLPDAIGVIYKFLKHWAEKEREFRLERYKRYKRGQLDYTEIQSEDEELFLSDAEKEQLFQKRQAVLRRMIPPQPPEGRNLRPRRRPRPIHIC